MTWVVIENLKGLEEICGLVIGVGFFLAWEEFMTGRSGEFFGNICYFIEESSLFT